MALNILGFDGFELYDSISTGACNLNSVWTIGGSVAGIITAGQGRFGGKAINVGCAGSSFSYLSKSIASTATIGLACMHNCNNGAGTSGVGIMFAGEGPGATNQHLTVGVSAANTLKLYRGGQNGTLLATATVTAIEQGYHVFEMYASIADSGGTCQVYVDGTKVIDFTGDTQNAGTGVVTTIGFGGDSFTGGTLNEYLDDVAWGSTLDRIGDFRVDNLSPVADTAQKDFSHSTGSTNFGCIDELPANSTDYVFSNTSGNEDLYTLSDLPTASETIFGIKITAVAEKDNAGARSLTTKASSNSTVASGSTTTLTTAYAPISQYLFTDPDTSAAWDDDGINALLAGFEVT